MSISATTFDLFLSPLIFWIKNSFHRSKVQFKRL